MKNTSYSYFIVFFLLAIIINCCSTENKSDPKPLYSEKPKIQSNITEYIFAVHPLHNSRRFFEVYQPLVDYINKNTDKFTIQLEASKDYGHFEEKLMNRKFHFALPNPFQSYKATTIGYNIFGKMGDDERFRGIIVVRKDSDINSLQDLKNKAISFPSATALAASMMPKYFMKTNGLNVEQDTECKYVGSQESSIMNVYLGKTLAGCTWPPPWESYCESHPKVAEALIVKWETEPLINNGLIVRDDINTEHVKIFSNLLFNLHKQHEGEIILQRINLSSFEAIHQEEYNSRVDQFLQKYIKLFGALPGLGDNK